jgi:hypothetical protein
MRSGFITTAYRNGVPDEEIMGALVQIAGRRTLPAH